MSFRVDDQHLHQIFFSGQPSTLPEESCPDPSDIWSAIADKELSRGKRLQVLDHCSRCRSCIQDLKTARTSVKLWHLELNAAVQLSNAEFPHTTDQPSQFWFKRAKKFWKQNIGSKFHNFFSLPAFAVVTCFVALVALKTTSGGPDKDLAPAFRNEPSTLEASPSPISRYRCTHSDSSAFFSWVQDRRASSYELLIFGEHFNLLCSMPDIMSTSTTISIDNCPSVAKENSFYWKIRNNYDDGSWSDSKYHIYGGSQVDKTKRK